MKPKDLEYSRSNFGKKKKVGGLFTSKRAIKLHKSRQRDIGIKIEI